MTMHRVLGAAVLALATLHVTPAAAQWAVYDSANFAKNALTAAREASAVAEQLKQAKTQLLQYATQLANLQQIPTSVWNSELGHELAAQAQGCTTIACVRRAAGQLSDVYGTAAQTAQEGASLYNQSADFGWTLNKFSQASGMSAQEIFSYEQQRAQAGQEGAETEFNTAQHLQDQLTTWQQKADANARAAQTAQGARDALQAVAAQSHLQTTQLSSLLQAATDANMAQAARDARDAQERQKEARAEERAREAEQGFEHFLSGGAQ